MAKVVHKGDGLKVLVESLKEFGDKKLEVGVFESAKYEDGTPVAGVAAVQEFGSPKNAIPPRPFMSTTIEEKKGEIKDLFNRGAKAVVNGDSTPEDALDTVGLAVAGQIKTTISEISSPPLSPVTLHLRKLKKQGVIITGSIVADAKKRHAAGEELDIDGVSSKPLIEDAILLNSITHGVK